MPAKATHSLVSLQSLLKQTNPLVLAPPAPTFGAQHLYLRSLHDLKARLMGRSGRDPGPLANEAGKGRQSQGAIPCLHRILRSL